MGIYLNMGASTDMRHWLLEYQRACANCGRKFAEMHPMENIVPHLQGNCVKNFDEQFLKSLHIATG